MAQASRASKGIVYPKMGKKKTASKMMHKMPGHMMSDEEMSKEMKKKHA